MIPVFPNLKGLDISTEEKHEALCQDKPLMIATYLDSICNLNCTFCFLDSGKSRKAEQIPLEKYKDVLKQARDMGAKTSLFFGRGEPFMDPFLFPLLEYSNQLGLYSVVFTNATLITKGVVERLKHVDISLLTSVKSFNPKTLEDLTRVKGSAARIHRGRQTLIDAGFNEGTKSRLGMDILICKQVYDEVPRMAGYCLQNNIFPMLETLLYKGRAAKNYKSLEVTDEQKTDLRKRLEREFPQLRQERSYFDGRSCDLDHYTIFVDLNGNVWPCFGREITVGNVMKQSLQEIWDLPTLKQIRQAKPTSCEMCPGREYNLKQIGLYPKK